MTKMDLSELLARGATDESIASVRLSAERASKFVFPMSFDVLQACLLMEGKIRALQHPAVPLILRRLAGGFSRVEEALLDVRRQYTERGYDSCQPNREMAKVISQLICAGGLWREGQRFLGARLSPEAVAAVAGLRTPLTVAELTRMASFVASYAAEQDFLFPGVTASDENVSDLTTLATETLLGDCSISVRHLTGVGGLRADRFWNFCLPFAGFTAAKMEEDKRFYPGLGLAYLLLTTDIMRYPNIWNLKEQHLRHFRALVTQVERLREQKGKITGLTLLHSTYLPYGWEAVEARKNQLCGSAASLREKLDLAFHTPSYEYARWVALGKALIGQGDIEAAIAGLAAIDHYFTFNSPIHLPWASQLSFLATNNIGRIRNTRGEHAIRYGVGSEKLGASLELRWYFGRGALGEEMQSVCLIAHTNPYFSSPADRVWVYSDQQAEVSSIADLGFLEFAYKRLKGEM